MKIESERALHRNQGEMALYIKNWFWVVRLFGASLSQLEIEQVVCGDTLELIVGASDEVIWEKLYFSYKADQLKSCLNLLIYIVLRRAVLFGV